MKKTLFTPLLSGVFILFIFFSFQSCLKDNFDFDKLASSEWDPTFAIPLVNASFGMKDMLEQTDSSLVMTDADGMVILVYKGESFEISADQLLELPEQNFTEFLIDGTEAVTLPVDGTITKAYSHVFSYTTFNGIELDSVWIKSGSLSFQLTSSFQHDGNVDVSIPAFQKNGVPFSLNIPFIYSGGPVIINRTLDMSGYSANFTTGAAIQDIPIEFTATLNYKSPNPINANDKISIKQTFGNLDFSGVFGYLGQQTFIFDNDTIEMSLFKNSDSEQGVGNFNLTNPKISLKIRNSMGIPIGGEVLSLETVNKLSQATSILPLNGGGFNNSNFLINSPLSYGNSAETNFLISNANANVTSLISTAQKDFIYGVKVDLNKNGIPTRNFITDKSKVNIDTEIELPLEGYAYGFTMQDTMPFNFSENSDVIESILIRSNINNGFPINVRIQVIFTDESYVKLDSLFIPGQNSLMLSGKINSSGRVIEPTKKITDVTFSKSRVPNLAKAKYVIIKAESESFQASSGNPNNPVVKIYDDYKLDVRLGLKVQGKISF